MAFTPGQYREFSNHPNLQWLRYKSERNHAVHQDTIKAKISEAIMSAFPDRATDENIRWVADKVGTPWGDVYTPPLVSYGSIHRDAVSGIEGTDRLMAQAVAMVFNGTATGRTAPGTGGVNHIHVGGNAQLNLLFDTATSTVLGVVNGHMDRTMSPSVRQEAERVSQRRGGPAVRMRVMDSAISQA